MPTNSIWMPLFTVLSPLTGKRCPRLVASPQESTPARPMSTDGVQARAEECPLYRSTATPANPMTTPEDARQR